MKLIAVLSWYEEPIAWLAELVGGLGRAGVDHIVALDGAYLLYPRGRARSESQQADVIQRTAAGCGMGSTVCAPQTPWIDNEVGKRDHLFRLAQVAVEAPGTDWFWVVDGDETIADAVGVKPMLEVVPAHINVAEALLQARANPQDELESFPFRKFFRSAHDPIAVTGNHYTYVRDGEIVWGDPSVQTQDVHQLLSVRVHHRINERPPARMLQRADYYRRRDEAGIEA